MLADAATFARLAEVDLASVLADSGATAVAALVPLAVVRAEVPLVGAFGLVCGACLIWDG